VTGPIVTELMATLAAVLNVAVSAAASSWESAPENHADTLYDIAPLSMAVE